MLFLYYTWTILKYSCKSMLVFRTSPYAIRYLCAVNLGFTQNRRAIVGYLPTNVNSQHDGKILVFQSPCHKLSVDHLFFSNTHAFQDPGTGIQVSRYYTTTYQYCTDSTLQPFSTPLAPVSSNVLERFTLPFRYLLGVVRTSLILVLALVYIVLVWGLCMILVRWLCSCISRILQRDHRFRSHHYTAP
jgi:hypothetical protein